jgi:type IV pilus assembly protein PilP
MTLAKKCAWLVPLLMVAQVAAQDKIERAPATSQEAVEKLLRAPHTVKNSLQALSEAMKAKLADATTESSAAKPKEAPVEAVEKKANPAEELRVSPATKRDPFRPFTLNTQNTQSASRRRESLSPLERYELGQLKFVGVIWDVKEPNGMVEDSAGLGYIVRVGTAIGPNEGKVKLIKPEEIIIEEAFVDVYGARKKREVPMKLSPETAQ